jgi:hypothetical protein
MGDAAEKASPEEEEQREDVAMDEWAMEERERDEAKVSEQEENVLLPLLKSMFPHVNDKVHQRINFTASHPRAK